MLMQGINISNTNSTNMAGEEEEEGRGASGPAMALVVVRVGCRAGRAGEARVIRGGSTSRATSPSKFFFFMCVTPQPTAAPLPAAVSSPTFVPHRAAYFFM